MKGMQHKNFMFISRRGGNINSAYWSSRLNISRDAMSVEQINKIKKNKETFCLCLCDEFYGKLVS